MIIDEARIYKFGSLTDKIIRFDHGINLIYGENEKGKTTIENFIKVMLFGFGKRREDRKKYIINNIQAKGELYICHNDRKIIIKRTFGKTKKEDTSKVIDAVTGNNISEIDLECPGQDLFGINKSTFEKTLFIGQLGVSFKKDKEEEIMDKIMAFSGVHENDVSPAKALEKLNGKMKELRTARGIGEIDILEKNREALIEQKFEGLNIAKKNMQWENELVSQKNNRKFINEEIKKLEIYKKYIKRLSIQKEYREINEYLSKSEKLKKEESIIENDLIKENNVIDMDYMDKLKELNNKYLFLHDKFEDINLKNTDLEIKINNLKNENSDYSYFDVFEDNIQDKLISLKYEFNNLNEKMSESEKLIESIKSEKQNIIEKRGSIFNFSKIEEIYNELEECLNNYDDKLRNLSYLMEKSDDSKSIDKNLIIMSFLDALLVILGVFLCLKSMMYKCIGIIFIVISVILGYFLFAKINDFYKDKKEKNKIELLKNEVSDIEKKLDEYSKFLEVNDYKSLFILLKKYKSYIEFEEKILIRISEKQNILDSQDYTRIVQKYNRDKKVIESFINVSGCRDLDQILEEANEYKKNNESINNLILKKSQSDKEKLQLSESIENIKNQIICKLNDMGIQNPDVMNAEVYIKEFSDKIKKREEIHRNLQSIEETYNYLLKDRDIEKIKNELNIIIDDNNDYSYKSEEEIEKQEKKYSLELIECEKRIKDLENNIKTRLIGKKNLLDIQEELFEIEKKISDKNKKYDALKYAYDIITESESVIRQNIGPRINQMVTKYFRKLSDGRYSEVILNEKYEMLVRYNDEILDQNCLSNGAKDQLYLSLRMAFINLIFKDNDYILFLDDAFVQYDDYRRENALLFLAEQVKKQCLIFTCQHNEKNILSKNSVKYNLINL